MLVNAEEHEETRLAANRLWLSKFSLVQLQPFDVVPGGHLPLQTQRRKNPELLVSTPAISEVYTNILLTCQFHPIVFATGSDFAG